MNIKGKIIEAGDLDRWIVGLVIMTGWEQLADEKNNLSGASVVVISAEDFAELQCYRKNGVTEELLRRNDGYIKVGRGCVIALESEMPIGMKK